MFQMRALNQEIIPFLIGDEVDSTENLEQRADRLIARLREERLQQSASKGMVTRLSAQLDEWIRTDASEYLDQPDFDDAAKVKIVSRLNRFNRTVQAYWRFLAILKPYIEHVQRKENRKVKILELASGSGDFTLALAEKSQKQGLPVEVYGSDYLDAHVQEGNRKAKEKGIKATFKTINAFDMHNVETGEFDIIFVAQTMHHFTPGQLAMMVAQASMKAGHAVIGIDGHRGPALFGLLPGMLVLNPDLDFMHDSLISMRKMYSEPELALIARLAAPEHSVKTFTDFPGYSVLEVIVDQAGHQSY